MLVLGRTAGFRPARLVLWRKRCGGVKMAVDLSMSVLVVDDYNTMIRIIRNL
jgi:hypothetical protein